MLKNRVEIKLVHPHRTEKLQIMIRYSLLRNPFRQNLIPPNQILPIRILHIGGMFDILGGGGGAQHHGEWLKVNCSSTRRYVSKNIITLLHCCTQ